MGCTLQYAKSLADPFKLSACVPDGSRNSGLFTLRQTGTITTGASGTACGVYLAPYPNAFIYPDSLSNNATVTIGVNWFQLNANTVATNYRRIRPVSYGLRLTYTGSSVTDSGVLVSGMLAEGTVLSSVNTDTAFDLSNQSQNYHTGSVRQGCEVIYKPPNEELAAEWHNADISNVLTTSTINHPILYAAVFGAATGGAGTFQYEAVVNFEGLYHNQGFLPGGLNSESVVERAEVGWFENAKNMIDRTPEIRPYLAQAFNFAVGAVQGYRAIRGTGTRALRGTDIHALD